MRMHRMALNTNITATFEVFKAPQPFPQASNLTKVAIHCIIERDL